MASTRLRPSSMAGIVSGSPFVRLVGSRSQNAYWIADPFQTGLSESKEIAARPNSAHVEV